MSWPEAFLLSVFIIAPFALLGITEYLDYRLEVAKERLKTTQKDKK